MSSMSLKRVNKELEFFYKRNYVNINENKNLVNFLDSIKIYTFMYKHPNINQENLHIIIEKDYKSLIEYRVPNDYPFKPFQIIKHNFTKLEWNKFLNVLCEHVKKVNNQKILYFFLKIQLGKWPLFLNYENKNNKCFCCTSYNCPINWSPKLKINNCLEEYIEVEFINKFVKKYNNKLLMSIYNNFLECYKLPEELFEIIVNKVL